MSEVTKEEQAYIDAAAMHYHRDGELELELGDNAAVSIGDGGAYVLMWRWVPEDLLEQRDDQQE